jgi:hypothetical protein
MSVASGGALLVVAAEHDVDLFGGRLGMAGLIDELLIQALVAGNVADRLGGLALFDLGDAQGGGDGGKLGGGELSH